MNSHTPTTHHSTETTIKPKKQNKPTWANKKHTATPIQPIVTFSRNQKYTTFSSQQKMDHSWCPVCDQQTFAFETLYCSEACRRKDALPTFSPVDTSPETFYEFPRCSSQKPYQSPYLSHEYTPTQTPLTSPQLHPSRSTTFYTDNAVDLSSSPSAFLISGLNLSQSPPSFNLGMPFYPNPSPPTTSYLATLNSNDSGNHYYNSHKPLKKKRSFTDSARRLFFFWAEDKIFLYIWYVLHWNLVPRWAVLA